MDPSKDTWGEEVNVEGYTGNFPPPIMAKDNNKIYYELQDSTKSSADLKKILEDANKENDEVFPKEYDLWTGPLARTAKLEYSKMVELKGENSKVNVRRFSPAGFTKFTKTNSSSDAIDGAKQNPKCLVNMKKKTWVDLYVGNQNFHGCTVDANEKFDEFSATVAAGDIVLHKAKIVDASGNEIVSTEKDGLIIDVEPVTGKALKGNIAAGIYLKVKPTAVYSAGVKTSIIP